jgi:hypothetical protein
MKAKKVWFDKDNILILTDNNETLCQPLRYYPRLKKATKKQRENYEIGHFGIHWADIDEDVSFESFYYDNEQPCESPVIATFNHLPEINISQFARGIAINPTLMAKYLCADRSPSQKRKKEIEKGLHELGKKLLAVQL